MIAGIKGMVGASIKRVLDEAGYSYVFGPSSKELDFRNYEKTFEYMMREKPDILIITAAKVGGIKANINNPVSFLQDNLELQTSLIKAAHNSDINTVIFLSSSCVYPRKSNQPMKEEYLMSGKLEPTNEGYALAKLSGMKLIEAYRNEYNRNYISLIPCNIYGPNDNFDLNSSHVVAGLIHRLNIAKENNNQRIELWGTGNAKRELMFSLDLADAIKYVIENPISLPYINVGNGVDITIYELAAKIAKIVGYNGEIIFDKINPDGMPQKLLDISILSNHGWKSSVSLDEGLNRTFEWFLQNKLY
jgi:GDP-L-fucose synthase